MTRLLEQHRHTDGVVAPGPSRAHLCAVKIGFGGIGNVFRIDDELSILTRSDGDPAGEVNRHRHYESLVVVGMLADQVDAAGRAIDAGNTAEAFAKGSLQVALHVFIRGYRATAEYRSSRKTDGTVLSNRTSLEEFVWGLGSSLRD